MEGLIRLNFRIAINHAIKATTSVGYSCPQTVIKPGAEITTREILKTVNKRDPGIEKICTNPKEDQQERLNGLVSGLIKLGIRKQSKGP